MSARDDRVRLVEVPLLLRIGRGVIEEVPQALEEIGMEGGRIAVLRGSGASSTHGRVVVDRLGLRGFGVQELQAVEGSIEGAEALADKLDGGDFDLVVAVGGGRVIDVGKLAASRTGMPFFSVPTSLAHDGISSPVASLPDRTGHRRSVGGSMPVAVLVDVEVVGGAPPETLRAGLGDLLSNLTALLDWRLAASRVGEPYDEFSALIAEHAALPLLAVPGLGDLGSVSLLAKGLVLSGLAMATAGTSRPCSGGEHLISHSLDALLGQDARFHGEQVALGTLVAARFHGHLYEEIRSVFLRCGLPTHPEALGLSSELLEEAVRRAPSTRPGRYTFLDEVDFTSEDVRMLLADALKAAG